MFEHASDATWALTQNGALLADRPLMVDAAADGGRQADAAAAAAAAKGKGKWRAPEGGGANPTEEVRCFVGNLAFATTSDELSLGPLAFTESIDR